MSNNPIEDIYIDRSSTSKNKKGKGLIILLIIILCIFIGIYCYFFNSNQESNKELFLKNIPKNNFKFFLDNQIYASILDKVNNSNSSFTSTISFSTTISNDFFYQFDVSKFLLDMNSFSDVQNKKNYNELKLSYSDNEIMKIKQINSEKNIAIMSEDIVNKYIGINYENLSEIFKKNLNLNLNIDKLINIRKCISGEKISIENEIIKKYYDIFSNSIPEQNFSKKEGLIITRDSDNIDVRAYTLILNKQELKKILKDIQNNDELLNQLVNENRKDKQEFNVDSNNIVDLNLIGTSQNNVINETELKKYNQDNDNINNQSTIELDNETLYDSELYSENSNEENSNVNVNNIEMEYEKNIDLNEILIHIVTFRKLDVPIGTLKEFINSLIQSLDNLPEKELNITLYVSNNGTEKISLKLPNNSNIDIEFSINLENEKKVKITYLEYNENEKNNSNGRTIEFYKLKKDILTTMDISYSYIENNEITKEVLANIITEGMVSSKNYKNYITIKYSDINGELNSKINNTIKFDKIFEIPELNEDNCLLLDSLDSETQKATIDAIIRKIQEVYDDKMKTMNLIDSNTKTSIVQQNEKEIKKSIDNREEVKNKLIATISDMMRVKIDNGSKLTIKDLEGLQIDGYELKTIITSNLAIITINGYTFHIDSDFNLSDAE